MFNTINVYWACLEKEWLRADQPIPILSKFIKDNSEIKNSVDVCPAFRLENRNVFGLKSLYSYNFSIDGNTIGSSLYDQEFYDWHVCVRNFNKHFFTFSQEFVFFTDSPSLNMTGGILPYFENNNITDRCTVIPGVFDIGKWYRPIEFAFFLKPQYNEFKIEHGEIFQYIKFHTDKKINFIQFKENDALKSYLKDAMHSRINKKNVFSLDFYYKKFNLKKLILKEIKGNVL
jgi:hypothetical protein